MDNLRRLFRRAQPPEPVRSDRKPGELTVAVAKEAHAAGFSWPVVIEDPKTATTTVPATYEGLLAFVCSWDTLLLDEEMAGFKAVVGKMVPMRAEWQPRERARRKHEHNVIEQMKQEDPGRHDRMSGWRV